MGFLLLNDNRLFGHATTPAQAALFMGTAMATTAFPVLARILYDLGINRTQIGVLAITAASVNDVVAWCLLAVILASTQHSPELVGVAVGGVALFTLIMVTVGRRLVRKIEGVWRASGSWSHGLVLVFLLIFLSAWITDRIGIHPFFGAFAAGLIFPRGELNAELKKVIEAFSVTLLLPFFFVYSGLNTQLGLLAEPRSLLLGLSIIAVATISNAGGSILGARLTKISWPDCVTLGILMNTRGLVELILINVGLEKGLISPTLFSALVLMALVTTMSSVPLIHALGGVARTTKGAKH
ncbi:MAG: cation:proton antiporter [Chloroflexota bacterium]